MGKRMEGNADTIMLNREDLLELTRRMTPTRNCFTRVAGGYMDAEGFVDQSFNVHFGKLSATETNQMLRIAKTVPFAETNKELKEHRLGGAPNSLQLRQLLTALIQCGLKNDALLMNLYEIIGEKYRSSQDYAIIVCQGNYDIPRKGTDKAEQWESEEVYQFLILAIGPQTSPNEPGETEWGFLYPSFSKRCADMDHIAIYQSHSRQPHPEMMDILGII